MKKIKLLTLFLLSFLILGCGANSSEKDYKTLMQENDYVIVDVRTAEEYNEGHIKEAINIPYDKITSSNLDKNKLIFVYCKSGNRSKKAYNSLKSLGYTVYNLGAYNTIDLEKER